MLQLSVDVIPDPAPAYRAFVMLGVLLLTGWVLAQGLSFSAALLDWMEREYGPEARDRVVALQALVEQDIQQWIRLEETSAPVDCPAAAAETSLAMLADGVWVSVTVAGSVIGAISAASNS